MYIMVTNYNDHWNDGQKTHYNSSMLRNGLNIDQLANNVMTLFIKRNKNRQFEKSWIGFVYAIIKENKNGKNIIKFTVKIDKEVECPDKFKNYSEGWYSDDNITQLIDNPRTKYTQKNEPEFFNLLRSKSTWEEFEDNTYFLLRIMGIHSIHQYDKNNQRGKADGFFKFGKMVVLYDCTLEKIFEENKKTQIENYCSQLSKDRIIIDSFEYSLKDCDKFVWIITKNNSSRLIKNIDDIKILEVSIEDLIKIYHRRLDEQKIDEKKLVLEFEQLYNTI